MALSGYLRGNISSFGATAPRCPQQLNSHGRTLHTASQSHNSGSRSVCRASNSNHSSSSNGKISKAVAEVAVSEHPNPGKVTSMTDEDAQQLADEFLTAVKSPAVRAKYFIIVRHGHSTWNEQSRIQVGSLDYPAGSFPTALCLPTLAVW